MPTPPAPQAPAPPRSLPSLDRLPLPDADRAHLTALAWGLGADEHYIGYPTLARALRQSLATLDTLQFAGQAIRVESRAALDALLGLPASEDVPDIPPGGQVARGRSTYPIIRCLLVPIEPAHAEAHRRLRALVVATALLQVGRPPPPIVAQAATQIRLAARAADDRSDLFPRLADLVGHELRPARLSRSCEALRVLPQCTDSQKTFLRALARLAETYSALSYQGDLDVAPVRRMTLNDESTDPLDAIPVQLDLSPLGPRKPTQGQDEPPDLWLVEETPTADPVSPQGLAAKGRRSARWIDAATRALPWDRAVLSPAELIRLQEWFGEAAGPQGNPQDRLVATVVALLLATGLDLEEISALDVGDGKDLDPIAEVYNRRPPPNEDAAQPDEGSRAWALPHGEAIALPLPSWAAALLPKDHEGPVGTWLTGASANWETALAERLAGLRTHAALRMTPPRIARTLTYRLQHRYADPALTYLLVGLRRHRTPVDLYYAAIPGSRLVEAYRDVTEELVPGVAMAAEPRYGAPVVPDSDPLGAAVGALIARTRATVASGDLVAAHNAYTVYTAMALMAATGHRPVADPFCYRDWIDLGAGLVIVSDKVVTERHRHRLVWLAPLACELIGAYERHLEALAARLEGGEGVLGQVPAAVRALLSGSRPGVPYLFMLGTGETLSVTPERLVEAVNETWPFPLNKARHVLATGLRDRGVPQSAIAAQLGHLETLAHPFGASGTQSPQAVGECLRPALEALLRDQGWQVVDGLAPPRHRGRRPRTLAPVPIHESVQLGPEGREAARRARRIEDLALVRRLVETHLFETTGGKTRLVADQDRLARLQDALLAETGDTPERARRCLSLLWRYVARLRRQGHGLQLPARLMALEGEPPPFSSDFLALLRTYRGLRTGFPHWLQDPGLRSEACPEVSTARLRVAECCLSAALFGGLAEPRHLEALAAAVARGDPVLLRDLPCFDLAVGDNLTSWRWFADPLSAALLAGLRTMDRGTPSTACETAEVVTAVLRRLGVSPGASPWQTLARIAAAGWTYQASPFLAAIITGRTAVQPLGISALMRLLADRRLAPLNPGAAADITDGDEVPASAPIWRPPQGSAPGTSGSRPSADWIRDLWSAAARGMGATPTGTDARPGPLRKAIRRELIALATRSPQMPPIVAALLAWGIDLTRHGTRHHRVLKPSTIQEYVVALARPLIEVFADRDPVALDAVELEGLYSQALDYAPTPRRRGFLAGRCGEFHGFLSANWGVEEPDPAVFGAAGAEHHVDANLLTPTEYARTLDLLRHDPSAGKRLAVQTAALLVLGYRFGLRVGEALRLQARDIWYADDRIEAVDIHGSLYGDTKTRAGVRLVPLVGDLSSVETEVVGHMRAWGDEALREDIQAPYFGAAPGSRELLDAHRALGRLHQALRQVSGDPGMRYHHLRRSWAQRVLVSALGEASEGPWAAAYSHLRLPGVEPEEVCLALTGRQQFSERTLHALAAAIGHSGVATTLGHYVHVLDLLIGSALEPGPLALDDPALAYVLGKACPAVRKLRSRLGIPAKQAGRLIQAGQWHKGLAGPSVQLLHHPAIETLPQEVATAPAWTLEDLDRALCAASERYAVASIARMRGMPPDLVSDLLEHAVELERRTGFALYGLARHLDRWTGELRTPPNSDWHPPETLPETARLRRYLRHLPVWTVAERAAAQAAAIAWAEAYHHAGGRGGIVFASRQDLDAFVAGLAPIGLAPQHFVAAVAVPEHGSSADRAPVAHPFSRIDRRATTDATDTKAVLSLIRGQTAVSYPRTLDRLMFLTAVHGAAGGDSDPLASRGP